MIYLEANNLYDHAMSKFLPASKLKWIDHKEFDLNKWTRNSSKECVLEVGLEYLKELRQLQNDYPWDLDKIEIKREMLPEYQLKIDDLCNIPIGNAKKLLPNFFDKEKYLIDYRNLQLYLRVGLNKKNTSRIKIQKITMIKTIYWIQQAKKNRRRKNGNKDGKALHIVMNNAVYGKTVENLRNRVDVKLVNNEKEYLKCSSKQSYMSHKTFDNNLDAIRTSKVSLKLNTRAYIAIGILELSKVLIYEFHYD